MKLNDLIPTLQFSCPNNITLSIIIVLDYGDDIYETLLLDKNYINIYNKYGYLDDIKRFDTIEKLNEEILRIKNLIK